MPTYDYRCKNCGERFNRFYKTYADYDAASPVCPNCESDDLARIISSVSLPKPTRDYSRMNSQEMLSVFESGDSRQVGEMFEQIGGADPRLGADYHDATRKLLDGQSMDKVEKDLQNQTKKEDTGKTGSG
jgi:putative FmdB family regulatory protein